METIIFTDGSSRGNPGPGGWGVIIVKHDNSQTDADYTQTDAEKSKKKIIELGGREEHTTNNRMELQAAISALSFLSNYRLKTKDYKLILYTDSSYVINGITKWVFGWQKNNWITKEKKEVLNRDLWEKLSKLVQNKKIEWKYVGGHVGIVGNERCDMIATGFADGATVDLYNGSIENYPIPNILNIFFDESKAKAKSSSSARSKAPAFSYVSKVDGIIEKHKTWKECEIRVKGVSGAKYKKSLTKDEEKKIIEEWR